MTLRASILLAILLVSACTKSSESTSSPNINPVRNSVFYVLSKGVRSTELRLYHPIDGDQLILNISGSSVPTNIFWSDNYGTLFYRIGSKYYRLPWKRGAKASVAVEFKGRWPVHQGSQTWLNTSTGTWRLYSIEFGAKNKTGYAAHVYDYDPKEEKWTQMASEETTMCEAGDGSQCGVEVEHLTKEKGKLILLSNLLDGMRAWPNMVRHQLEDMKNPKGKIVIFPNQSIQGAGISARLVFGDTLHALAPIHWVGKNGGTKPLYVSSDYPCGSQVAFEQSQEWALTGTEYSMECAKLAKMSNGEIVFSFPRNAKNTVWVPELR